MKSQFYLLPTEAQMTRQVYFVLRRHWYTLSMDYAYVYTGKGGISVNAVSWVRWWDIKELMSEELDSKFTLEGKIIIQNEHGSVDDRTAYIGGRMCWADFEQKGRLSLGDETKFKHTLKVLSSNNRFIWMKGRRNHGVILKRQRSQRELNSRELGQAYNSIALKVWVKG